MIIQTDDFFYYRTEYGKVIVSKDKEEIERLVNEETKICVSV